MPDPKTFKEIEDETKERDKITREFLESTRNQAEYNRYEQSRIQGKQGLKNMLVYYRGREKGDEKLASIMSGLDKLANMNSTSDSSYWNESDAFVDAMKQMDEYVAELDRQENELYELSKQQFFKNGKWLSEKDLEASNDENLKDLNRRLNLQQNSIDDKRFLISDLKNYIESQTTGNLLDDIPPAVKHDKTDLTPDDDALIKKIFNSDYKVPKKSTKSIPQGERNPQLLPPRHIDGRGIKMDLRDNSISITNLSLNVGDRKTVSRKDNPLFPHEPCANDITQGYIGDCFYLASIARIAETHPEKIKEMMRENKDGSVTVRLYSRNTEGKYAPVFVTLDKETERLGVFQANAKNSLWVNCLERALAISGLMSRYEHGYSEPVPENINAIYRELKEKQAAGLLKGEKLQQARQAYPWLFSPDYEKAKLMPWPSIDSIRGGSAGFATEILLGPGYDFSAILITESKEKKISEEIIQNDVYNRIRYQIDRKLPVNAGMERGTLTLEGHHEYTVMDAYEHDGKRYIRLRNPHGTEEPPATGIGVTAVDNNQGIFDMELSAFVKHFGNVSFNGAHRDEIRMESPLHKKYSEDEKKQDPDYKRDPKFSENMFNELIDPDLLRDPSALRNFLNLAPFAELNPGKPDGKRIRENPAGDQSSLNEWADNLIADMKAAGVKGIPENPEKLRVDLSLFNLNLLETIQGCLAGKPSDRNAGENMKDVLKTIKDSKAELQKCFDEASKPFVEKAYNQVVARAEKLAEQLQNGKLPGEEKLDKFYQSLNDKINRIPDQHELYAHFTKNADNPNELKQISGLFRNEAGVRMVRFTDHTEQSLRSMMLACDSFVLKDLRPEAGKGLVEPGESLPPATRSDRVDVAMELGYNGFMQYKKMLSDLDKTLSSEKGWRDKSSPESTALRQAVKDVQASLAGKGRIGYAELQEQLDKLQAPLDAYEQHCADNPRRLSRRQNRLKACGMLRRLQQSAHEKNPKPLDEYQKNYASRLVKAGSKKLKKDFTPQQVNAIAERMLQDPQFRGAIANQNVFHMQNASESEVAKDMKSMMSAADKYIRPDETKAFEKTASASAGQARTV